MYISGREQNQSNNILYTVMPRKAGVNGNHFQSCFDVLQPNIESISIHVIHRRKILHTVVSFYYGELNQVHVGK